MLGGGAPVPGWGRDNSLDHVLTYLRVAGDHSKAAEKLKHEIEHAAQSHDKRKADADKRIEEAKAEKADLAAKAREHDKREAVLQEGEAGLQLRQKQFDESRDNTERGHQRIAETLEQREIATRKKEAAVAQAMADADRKVKAAEHQLADLNAKIAAGNKALEEIHAKRRKLAAELAA